MSDRLRASMQARQAARPIDLDRLAEEAQGEIGRSLALDNLSPIPVGKEHIMDLYNALYGESMASKILEQYQYKQRKLAEKLLEDSGHGMVKSVTQLDR